MKRIWDYVEGKKMASHSTVYSCLFTFCNYHARELFERHSISDTLFLLRIFLSIFGVAGVKF